MMLVLQKTARTRIIEFMREPFGGRWIGEPGFFTVAQIAEGADCSPRQARRLLEKMAKKNDVRFADAKPARYALPAPVEAK
jgi:hypothetical protein